LAFLEFPSEKLPVSFGSESPTGLDFKISLNECEPQQREKGINYRCSGQGDQIRFTRRSFV